MATNLARWVVSLEAETAKYRAELEKANQKLSSFTARQARSLDTIKRGFAALGGAAVIRQLTRFVVGQVEAVDALGEMADAAGIGVEQMQRLQFAFGQLTQMSEGEVTRALTTFNKRLGEARGGSEKLQKAFTDLGVDLSSDTGPALEQAFKGIAGIDDQSKRSAASAKVFSDRIGPKMAGALKGTTDALNKTQAAAVGIFTGKQAVDASRLADQFDRISKLFTAELTKAILDNASSFETLAVALGNVATKAVTAGAKVIELLKKIPVGVLPGPMRLLLGLLASEEPPDMSKGKLADVFKGPPATPNKPVFEVVQPESIKKANAELAEFNEKMRQFTAQSQAAMARARGPGLTDEQLKRAADITIGVLQGQEEMARKAEEVSRQMSEYSLEAARNMQSAFAEFLFAPFEDGVRGMLTGFLDAIRRMVANQATAQLFGLLGGLSTSTNPVASAIGKFFGGGQALGGNVSGSKIYQVNERGPEFFSPGGSGRVIPLSRMRGGMGGLVVNVNASQSQNPAQTAAVVKFAVEAAVARVRQLDR